MIWAMIVLAIAALLLGGSVCGILAIARLRALRLELEQLRYEIRNLNARFLNDAARAPVAAVAVANASRAAPPSPMPKKTPLPSETPAPPTLPAPPTDAAAVPQPIAAPATALSLEMRLGVHWIIWVGAIIFLGGVALGLKYTYDHNLIGPGGRILIGALTGIAALFMGEYYERRKLVIPFQAFTGAGLAIFYLCIFFAFQVYQLTGAGIAMLLAVCVTGLAIALSVLHNALPIALLAVVGGYLSPVFLSTGENAPWALFTYVALLNLVALGAAWFRRWRLLDLCCLTGTALLYLAWYHKFYTYPEELAPALFYASLFYLMFMIAPVLYSLVRGIPEGLPSMTLIIGNSLFWLFCYYNILYEAHQHTLGWVALIQALLVLLLYSLWMRRVQEPSPTAQSLLVIAAALLALVVPLWLRFYAVPVSWAAQGVVVVWLSFRFKNPLCCFCGVAMLFLAVGGLVYHLPPHDAPFTLLLNRPFGGWLFVIAGLALAAWIISRHWHEDADTFMPATGALALLALAMTCFILSVEIWQYWELQGSGLWFTQASVWLVVLWLLIPMALVWAALQWRQFLALLYTAQAAYVVALLVFLVCLFGADNRSHWLAMNMYFIPRAIFLALLWRGVAALGRVAPPEADTCIPGIETAGYVGCALLAFAELVRWGNQTVFISSDMAVGIVSAVWALQACILIWYGLVTNTPLRRYAGFALFAVATGKTVLVDAFNLDAVYRIISWLGIGLLLVIAALLYQRYSVLLLSQTPDATGDEKSPAYKV